MPMCPFFCKFCKQRLFPAFKTNLDNYPDPRPHLPAHAGCGSIRCYPSSYSSPPEPPNPCRFVVRRKLRKSKSIVAQGKFDIFPQKFLLFPPPNFFQTIAARRQLWKPRGCVRLQQQRRPIPQAAVHHGQGGPGEGEGGWPRTQRLRLLRPPLTWSLSCSVQISDANSPKRWWSLRFEITTVWVGSG